MEKNDSFERPAIYWLRRAKQAEENGDPVRAAVLERHAMHAEPDNADVSLRYMLTLRRLGCYESSNREAFAALARGSKHMSLYGVIGQNLLDLDFRKAAFDAMDVYLSSPRPSTEEWEDEVKPHRRADPAGGHGAYPPRGTVRHYRFRGLMDDSLPSRFPSERTGLSSARRTVERHLSQAVFYARKGDVPHTRKCLHDALVLNPNDPTTLVGAVEPLQTLGLHAQACALLCRAALYACKPRERQLICQTSDQLGEPGIALAMLTRMQRQMPTRLPVCHDLAVALCRVGRAEEALRYAHLCREIDPDDLEGQWLLDCVTALTRGEKRRPAYWGVPDRERIDGLLAPLLQSFADGSLAEELQNDPGTRQRFLYMMEMPLEQSLVVLKALAKEPLPRELLCPLLREALMRRPEDTPVKRYALEKLAELDEKPPYPIWAGERFRMAAPEYAREVR